jgi:aminopeptidase
VSTGDHIRALAGLVVRFGANVQPGQIVAISYEAGHEPLMRAIAEECYRQGALFVDTWVFDPHVKRARLSHAQPDSLSFVPDWYPQRMLALGEARGARIVLTGPVEPDVMDGIESRLLAMDMLPRLKESSVLIEERITNWVVIPSPTAGWAELVHPKLPAEAALDLLWQEVADVCRLREPDPVAAWEARLAQLDAVRARLDALELDAVRFEGPGTDLTIGLLPSSCWQSARFATAEGIVHTVNIPTEELFTTPDPRRAEGYVTSTKPLFVSERLIEGLRVRFEGGEAVEIEADAGAEILRGLCERDAGGARLGEVALVDRESRVGAADTVFFDTLLDENAASHIALGQAYGFCVEDAADHSRMNESEIHVDFMIGSADVEVTGVCRDGTRVPLLRAGEWQV